MSAGERLTDVEAGKADEATELVAVVVKANLGLDLPPVLRANIRAALAEHIAEHRDAPEDIGPGLLARICTQIDRLGDRLDADTITLWRAAVADRNVTSPPAMGCLLALVEEAVGVKVCAYRCRAGGWCLESAEDHGTAYATSANTHTRAEALVEALEEAP